MTDWNKKFGIPDPFNGMGDTYKTLERLAYPMGRHFEAIHKLTQNNPLLQQQKMLKALTGTSIFTSGFEVPKMPKTAIDVLSGIPAWHISNYIDSFSSITAPQIAMNVALTGLTRSLISSSKTIIDDADIEEIEKQERYKAVENLEKKVERKEQVTKQDILDLKDHFSDLAKQGNRKNNISIGLGIVSILISIILFLKTEGYIDFDLSIENNNTDNDSKTEIANDTKEIERLTYEVLSIYGLRQTTANLHLRGVPSTESETTIQLVLPKGTYVEIIDYSTPYWAKVKCDNPKNPDLMIEGWVSKRYLGEFTPNPY